jgi:hypothetical protein
MFHVLLIEVLYVLNPDHLKVIVNLFHSLKVQQVEVDMYKSLAEMMPYVEDKYVVMALRDLLVV